MGKLKKIESLQETKKCSSQHCVSSLLLASASQLESQSPKLFIEKSHQYHKSIFYFNRIVYSWILLLDPNNLNLILYTYTKMKGIASTIPFIIFSLLFFCERVKAYKYMCIHNIYIHIYKHNESYSIEFFVSALAIR